MEVPEQRIKALLVNSGRSGQAVNCILIDHLSPIIGSARFGGDLLAILPHCIPA
tara:strand:- start:20724 stop:20885 length:162 start_codon:yes stop_codon:yes gene_type:complete